MNFKDENIQKLLGDGSQTLTDQVGYKFFEDGEPMPFAGNTLICHIPRPSPVFDALVKMQNRLKAIPEAKYFSYLPPASFHMTVFEGVNDTVRELELWPKDLNLDMPVSDVTDFFKTKLELHKSIVPTSKFPTTFKVSPTYLYRATSLRLKGANYTEEFNLRKTRSDLAELLHLKKKDHASYGFHITLAYQLRFMKRDEAERVYDNALMAYEAFSEDIDEITLGELELCQFDDMHEFRPVLILK